MANVSRWEYLQATLIWRGATAILAVAGAYDLFVGEFASDWPRIGDGFGLLGDALPFYVWVIAFLVLSVAATFEGGYRQLRAATSLERPLADIAQRLEHSAYAFAGEPQTSAELFQGLAPLFREPVSQQQLQGWFYQRIQDSIKSGPSEPVSGQDDSMFAKILAGSILNEWFTAGLLDAETIHFAGRPPTSRYTFLQDLPRDYSVYRLSALGREVLQYLKARPSQPRCET